MIKKQFKVEGMHCASCAAMIEADLEDAGVHSCACSYAKQILEVEFDEAKISHDGIISVVAKTGYKITS